MYKTLIVEPQDFSLRALLNLPVWGEDKEGFVCTKTAADGQEALHLMQTMQFDLVLMEINLSIYDGLQILKQIHKDNQPPLIVFISDIVTFSYAREGFIYGAFDYLPKPVSEESIMTLFKRAAAELEKHKKSSQAKNTPSKNQYIFFSDGQIQSLAHGFLQQNNAVLNEFRDMLKTLYHAPSQTYPPDIAANNLYVSVVDIIYDSNSWLQLYLPQDFHKKIDYLILHDSDDFIDYYQRKFTYLYEFVWQMKPRIQDETLQKVYLYILYHPEEDLKITAIAKKFYLNHTYLSNLFSKKSNIGCKQLVTMVKLKRAEYLITYTTTPLTDIAYQLGYKDIHYFNRIYKNITGKSPSESVRDTYGNYDYSI